MKLSLLLPTYNSAATIERTLRAALRQRHRPLEIVVYDETSADGTREIVRRLLDETPEGVESRLLTAESNSGPVRAWRVALHDATGDWCTFVWADDVLREDFSEQLMAAAERARAAGRVLVTCGGEVEMGGEVSQTYSADTGLLTPQAFSAGMFFRRYPLTQICATYEMGAAREVFDRHIDFDNPLGFDYNRHPYGNDVGYLSELAAAGGGTERLGESLVRLTDSETSMTRAPRTSTCGRCAGSTPSTRRGSGARGRSRVSRAPASCGRWASVASPFVRSCCVGARTTSRHAPPHGRSAPTATSFASTSRRPT